MGIVLLKYIRAEELNVESAAGRLERTLIFRADCRIDHLRNAELPECFQGHDSISGIDEDGRPIMISKFGTMDIDKVFENVEAFVRYRAMLMEQAIALLSFKKGKAEDLLQLHDYSGVISSMYDSKVKQCVTSVSKVFGEHYPEFKGKTMFANFPSVFSGPFKAFAQLLPEATRNKFVILGNQDQLELFKHIRPELVPENVGGLLRDPPSKLDGRSHVVNPGARKSVDVCLMEIESGPETLAWEIRVCYQEVAFEIIFKHSEDDREELVEARQHPNYLQAEDAVVSGEYSAAGGGKLIARIKNDNAWFKTRVCICQAGRKGLKTGGTTNGGAKTGGYGAA